MAEFAARGNVVSFATRPDPDKTRATAARRQRRYRQRLRERAAADPAFAAEREGRKRAQAFMPAGRLEDLIAAVQRFERTARDDDGPVDALGQTAATALKDRLTGDLANALRYLPAARVATAATAAAALAEFLRSEDAADAAQDPAVQKAAKRKATAAFRRFEAIRTGALVPDGPPAEWGDDVFDVPLVKSADTGSV